MNSVRERHIVIYLFNKILYLFSNINAIISTSLSHFKSLRSLHLRKAKLMLIPVLLQALSRSLFSLFF